MNAGVYKVQSGKPADAQAMHFLELLLQAASRAEQSLRILFERNPIPTLVYDRTDRRILAANEAACAFFGYEASQIANLPIFTLFPDATQAQVGEMLASDHPDSYDCWQMMRQDGSTVDAVISTRLSQMEGYAITIVSVFDVTERRRIERRMAHMARHDELTGLANRSHCHEHLRDILDHALPDQTVTIALVDLDHFKAVNDTYGHQFGDTLLTDAALRMRECVPPEALLCRIGGDEFAVIFHHSTPNQTEVIARSIIGAISEPFLVKGNIIHIGATIGFASSPSDSKDAETLLRYADLALYAAKGERRGSCKRFEARMDEAAQEKNKLEKDFRQAIMEGQLEVHYQPMVNLDSGAIECYEALARWRHPQRGYVSPDVFIPLAEEMGLIDQIGRYVLQTACHTAKSWTDDIKLSVNVSPLQFRNGNLLSMVINALSVSGLPAERLELEITEAVLMEKGPRPAAIIRNLRALGIGISLDDFGTGFSSLSYLLSYPFTKIKIDKSFVLSLQHETNSRAVIRAVIGLGRNLGLTVAAEGVENEMERDYLQSEGCGQGQGFLFGHARPEHLLFGEEASMDERNTA